MSLAQQPATTSTGNSHAPMTQQPQSAPEVGLLTSAPTLSTDSKAANSYRMARQVQAPSMRMVDWRSQMRVKPVQALLVRSKGSKVSGSHSATQNPPAMPTASDSTPHAARQSDKTAVASQAGPSVVRTSDAPSDAIVISSSSTAIVISSSPDAGK